VSSCFVLTFILDPCFLVQPWTCSVSSSVAYPVWKSWKCLTVMLTWNFLMFVMCIAMPCFPSSSLVGHLFKQSRAFQLETELSIGQLEISGSSDCLELHAHNWKDKYIFSMICKLYVNDYLGIYFFIIKLKIRLISVEFTPGITNDFTAAWLDYLNHL